MKVHLQVFSYREKGLAETLDEWVEQSTPEWADVTYQAAVTPEGEKGFPLAGMPEHAIEHPVFEYLECPQGKLSARNHAHNRAIGDGADVIIACDADAPPIGDNTLSELLKPFRGRDDVVASMAIPHSPLSPTGIITNIWGFVEDIVQPHTPGQCHAISREGWIGAGQFNTDLDETDVQEVRLEEEFNFYERLSGIGRVIEVPEATVYNSTRRLECKLGLKDDGYCDRLGSDTF